MTGPPSEYYEAQKLNDVLHFSVEAKINSLAELQDRVG